MGWPAVKINPLFIYSSLSQIISPVGWGCGINRLHLCSGVTHPPNECPGYDSKKSNGEVPVMLELWGMWSSPSLPSLQGPPWPEVVEPDTVLCMGQIELNCVLMLNWIIQIRNVLTFKWVLTWNWSVWIRTVWLNWIARNRNAFDN